MNSSPKDHMDDSKRNESGSTVNSDQKSVATLVLKQRKKRVDEMTLVLEKHRTLLNTTTETLREKIKEIESAKTFSYNESLKKDELAQKRAKTITVGLFCSGFIVIAAFVSYVGVQRVGGAVEDGARLFASSLGLVDEGPKFAMLDTFVKPSEEGVFEVWAVRERLRGQTPESGDVQPENKRETTTDGDQLEGWEFANRTSSSPERFELIGKMSTELSLPALRKPPSSGAGRNADSTSQRPQKNIDQRHSSAPIVVGADPDGGRPSGYVDPQLKPRDSIEEFEKNFSVVRGPGAGGAKFVGSEEKRIEVGTFLPGTRERVIGVNKDGSVVTDIRVLTAAEAKKIVSN